VHILILFKNIDYFHIIISFSPWFGRYESVHFDFIQEHGLIHYKISFSPCIGRHQSAHFDSLQECRLIHITSKSGLGFGTLGLAILKEASIVSSPESMPKPATLKPMVFSAFPYIHRIKLSKSVRVPTEIKAKNTQAFLI
jgi:hypothetical protein